MAFYKFLNEDGTSCNGGSGKWNLPENGQPGEWMPYIETLKPCESGYHLCEESDLIEWIGPTLYLVEGRGKSIRDVNKTVFQEARLIQRVENWNVRTVRLFACDCAERVLTIFENEYPSDTRLREAIRVARLFADGEASENELKAASAAASADWASWAAASAAASAARAVWAASRAADWASWAADSAAEREWQTRRLMEYLKT